MQILLIVKISTFILNTVSTFMKYSKISGMRNLNLTQTSTRSRNCIHNFYYDSTRCRRCLLRIKKTVFPKIKKVSVKKIFYFPKTYSGRFSLSKYQKKNDFGISSSSIYDISIVCHLIFTNSCSMTKEQIFGSFMHRVKLLNFLGCC